jgi:hypothetical protein
MTICNGVLHRSIFPLPSLCALRYEDQDGAAEAALSSWTFPP